MTIMNPNKQGDVATIEREDIKIKIPKKYKAILLNDNFTTVDFVISVLVGIFNKSMDDALRITTHVHNNGNGIAGIYTR